MATITVEDKEHWHKIRASHVGASEVAALFNVSPWVSRWTLWHQKAGGAANPIKDSEWLEWGQRLEPVIAEVLAERMQWRIQKVHRYIVHPKIEGMGASLDFEIIGHEDGAGCFEIKNVSGFAFRDSWQVEDGVIIEAPLHYQLQLQHQMAVTGRSWGALGLLVDGSKGYVWTCKRHEPTIAKIEAAVNDFWDSVAEGQEPPLEGVISINVLNEWFGAHAGNLTVADLSDNPEVDDLCNQYESLGATESEAKNAKEQVKAQIIQLLGKSEAELATTASYKITYKEQSRAEVLQKASKFRVLRLSKIKAKG
jgi:putative phage-type endonuclease